MGFTALNINIPSRSEPPDIIPTYLAAVGAAGPVFEPPGLHPLIYHIFHLVVHEVEDAPYGEMAGKPELHVVILYVYLGFPGYLRLEILHPIEAHVGLGYPVISFFHRCKFL